MVGCKRRKVLSDEKEEEEEEEEDQDEGRQGRQGRWQAQEGLERGGREDRGL